MNIIVSSVILKGMWIYIPLHKFGHLFANEHALEQTIPCEFYFPSSVNYTYLIASMFIIINIIIYLFIYLFLFLVAHLFKVDII